jgi:pyruvate dehydrogenase E1 component alpha subunit
MLLIRRFEEKSSELWSQGLLPGLVHLYIGEEAVAVGVCSNLRKDDYIVSTHRGHGHLIAKGADVRRMMAELMAKATGCNKGKGGSMHICDFDMGIVGATGIVGSGIPIASGVGLSIQSRGTDQVCISFFGDGASNTGAFHEGINLAAAWKLPVVFVCENNMYAISVPASKSTSAKNVADRGAGYGIPGVTVDGMDVIAVYEVVGEAVKRARSGMGPTLVECKTYRFRGHHEGDPKRGLTYRTEDELRSWEARCPVKTFRARLIEQGVLTEAEADGVAKSVEAEIAEAVQFAIDSPPPDPSTAAEDVFR